MDMAQKAQEIINGITEEHIQEMITQAIGGLNEVILYYDIEEDKYLVSDYDYNRLNNDYSFIYIDHLKNTEDIEELLLIPCSCCLDCPHTENDKFECLFNLIQEYHRTTNTYNEVVTSLYHYQHQQQGIITPPTQ